MSDRDIIDELSKEIAYLRDRLITAEKCLYILVEEHNDRVNPQGGEP